MKQQLPALVGGKTGEIAPMAVRTASNRGITASLGSVAITGLVCSSLPVDSVTAVAFRRKRPIIKKAP